MKYITKGVIEIHDNNIDDFEVFFLRENGGEAVLSKIFNDWHEALNFIRDVITIGLLVSTPKIDYPHSRLVKICNYSSKFKKGDITIDIKPQLKYI